MWGMPKSAHHIRGLLNTMSFAQNPQRRSQRICRKTDVIFTQPFLKLSLSPLGYGVIFRIWRVITCIIYDNQAIWFQKRADFFKIFLVILSVHRSWLSKSSIIPWISFSPVLSLWQDLTESIVSVSVFALFEADDKDSSLDFRFFEDVEANVEEDTRFSGWSVFFFKDCIFIFAGFLGIHCTLSK